MSSDHRSNGTHTSPPPLAKLPPPVPFTTERQASLPLRQSTAAASDIGPPTPPKPGNSFSGNSEPEPSSPNGLAQSKSWTQLAPQRPFVNGRGNVQLPGAPQRFIPSNSPSSSTLNLGLPVQKGPSIRNEGQQTYVRRSPSPEPTSRVGAEKAGEGTMSFPSQFGVRQKVAIRTSSRPQARSTSSTGAPRNSDDGLRPDDNRNSIHNSISSHSHLSHTSSSSSTSTVTNSTPMASPQLMSTPTLPSTPAPLAPPPPPPQTQQTSSSLSVEPKTSVLDRPRPKTPDPFSSSSRSQPPIITMRHAPRPSAVSTLSTSTNDDLNRRNTPSPALSTSNSVLDRPRPKTPDPFLSHSPVPSTRAPSIVSESPTITRSTAPTSVMDRPRPKTPDPGAMLGFGNEEEDGDLRSKTPDIGGVFRFAAPVEEDRSRPKTPDSSSVFAFNASTGGGSVDSHGLGRSVMDRPRPRTPDPQGWLDSATTSAQSFDTQYTRTIPSSNTSYLQSSTPSLPYSNSSASIPSISRPSFDSSAHSYSDHSVPTTSPRGYPPSRSRQSTGPSSALASEAPLLNLDFDFGSSFSNSDTLFGLSDLLSFSSDSTPKSSQPPPPQSSSSVPEPSNVSTATPPSINQRPSHNYNSSSSSINTHLTRNLPRKEAPKVDPVLEFELEMERAIPLNEESESRRHHRDWSNATDDSERDVGSESGRSRTPAGFMGRIRKKGDSISSMRSIVTAGSISEASVGGSPQPVKRRRRRSLASLLSFASNSGKEDRESDHPPRNRTPEPNMISSPVLTSVNGVPLSPYPRSHSPAPLTFEPSTTDLSFDKSLPPTPIRQSVYNDDDRTPPASAAPNQMVHRPAHERTLSGNNPLTRQLSRLRQRSENSNHSHSSSSGSKSGFQVVSGSTTRNRGTGGQGSISSLASSQQTHSSSRKDSSEFGYQPRNESVPFTALPLSEPSQSQPSQSQPSSLPFGKRLVQRITKSNNTSSSRPTDHGATPQTWTMPLKDHDEDTARPRKPPRRGSLTSLLNLGDSSTRPTIQKKKSLLGMSLPAGRKSDDLLVRGFGKEREPRENWVGSVSDNGHGDSSYRERRSFDLLTDREAIPRRPSTDNLLTLASAKLSKMALSDENGDPVTPSPTTPTANGVHPSGDISSGQSTPSVNTPDNTASIISTAQLVKRSDGSPTMGLQDAESPLFSRTAAPMLVRSDSLRSSPRQSVPVPGPPFAGAVRQQRTSQESSTRSTQSQPWKKRGKIPDSGLGSDASMSSAWLDVEDALGLYSKAVQDNHPDRSLVLANTLLPFLKKEEDNPATRTNERLAKRQRDILFGWLNTLTTELKEMQPAHRGACLESVGAIAESHFLSASTLENDLAGQSRYRTALVTILQFAVDKLNEKAVYANTLVFSGRVFALAFWRIDGVGLKLLRALPQVKRAGLKRILEEAGVDEYRLPPVELEAFPSHLSSLCLQNFRAYTSLLLPLSSMPSLPDDKYLIKDGDISVEMSGNWLIRWTASDSDLPFAFYRAYHKQLASYLIPIEAREEILDQEPMSPSTLITAPGFLFLAASLLEKSDALVHRKLRSVTSMGPHNSNFNTNDSANLSFGAKPKVLELAHRRLVQTLLEIVGGPPAAPGNEEDSSDTASRRHAFRRMMQVWIKACVKRTSMWDTRSVFILLDLLEGLIFALTYPSDNSRSSSDEEPAPPKPDPKFFDMLCLEFVFPVLKKILLEADNTVTLMRTISFLYAHFEVFTMRIEDRTALCEGIILDEAVFTRLFLSYNQGTRGFWIRLLVWRLSRLGVIAKEQNPNLPPDEGILALFGLLNVRLETIRKRHDQLEPLDDVPDDGVFFRPKRSTICSTRGVKEAPWTVDELAETFEEEGSEYEEETQELVRAIPPPPSSTSSTGGGSTKKGDNKTVSKVVSWLRGGLGKNKKGLKVVPVPDSQIDPFTVERSATIRRPDEPFIEDSGPSQEWPQANLPTTIETGVVRTKTSSTPPATPEKNGLLSPTLPQRNKSTSSSSSGSQRRNSRPTSPAFFSFEFENGVITRSDVDPAIAASTASNSASPSPSSSAANNGTSDNMLPTSPIRRMANAHPDPQSAMSPRASIRFSKRISILPPAALDLLKKERGEAVPPIPAQYRRSMQQNGYDKKLHPYAVRGLRDLEDSYDEWTEWVAKLQEDEDSGQNRGNNNPYVDLVPRLAVSWPTSFTDD